MNRYFHFIDDDPGEKRVIVFVNGSETGYSWWRSMAGPNTMEWTLREMRVMPSAKEIQREKAQRIVPHVP